MTSMTFEVSRTIRSTVYVDPEKLDAEWKCGTTWQEVKGCLREMGLFDLIDSQDEDEVGIAVEGEIDDYEISYIGTAA